MDYTDREYFLEYLPKVLTEKRFKHSLGVAKTARELAESYGLDADKAEFTGLVHDIAKCISVAESDRLVRKYGLPTMYLNNTALAHSKIGAAIMKYEFGIDDEEIIMGILSHTTGRAGMSLFEKIIYVADATEPGRDYREASSLRNKAYTEIDAVCLEILEFTIDTISGRGSELDRETVDAYEYIKGILHNKEN